MAKPPYNKKIAVKVLKVLLEHPDGIWLSRLAKEAGVPISTTSHYIDHHLYSLIDETKIGDKKSVIRIIRIKQQIYDKYVKSMITIDNLLRTIDIIKKYRS